MKNSIKTISVLLAIGLISCSSQGESNTAKSYAPQRESKVASYEETSEIDMGAELVSSQLKKESKPVENQQEAVASLAASIENDGHMRFIRKAQLRFQTKSVRNTTYYLENSVVNLGGIVTNTNLYSDIESVKKIAISNDNDSSLKVTTYQMNNSMTIRIPNNRLDSLLKIISKSVMFLDSRVITANEISLVELRNNLERKRLAAYQNKLTQAIKNKSDKMSKVVDAYESMLRKQQQEDEATIRNLELDYEVEYSTVQLTIYQASSVDKELVENELNIKDFEPSFFTQLLESLVTGWNAVLFLIIQLANLWFLVLLVVVGIIVYNRKK